MFGKNKQKIYTIRFEKTRHNLKYVGVLKTWTEVTDDEILKTITSLQKEYNFKVLSVDLSKGGWPSQIEIKCNEEDQYNIFTSFVSKLSNSIESVTIF